MKFFETCTRNKGKNRKKALTSFLIFLKFSLKFEHTSLMPSL